MSVSNLCGICEADAAVEHCRECGTAVCARHFVREKACCVDCARR